MEGNTTTMRRHMTRYHEEQWNEIQLKQISTSGNIKSCFNQSTQYAPDSIEQVQFDEECTKLVVKQLLPLRFVDTKEFQDVIKKANRRLTVPKRQKMTKKLIPAMFNQVMGGVKEDISKAKHVSITTDMWSSAQTNDYNTVTAHYINIKKKRLESKILDCSRFDKDHTSENLARELVRVCKIFDVDDKLVAALGDKAANIRKAKTLIKRRSIKKLTSLDCYAHGLNSVHHDAFDDIPKLIQLKAKVQKITNTTKQSSKAKRMLLQCQKTCGVTDPMVLLKMIAPRWNTEYIAYKRVLKIPKKAFQLFILEWNDANKSKIKKNKNIKLEMFTDDDWTLLQEVTQLLEPLYDATTEISADKVTTLSKVLPMTQDLIWNYSEPDASLSSTARNLKKELLKSLKNRFGDFDKIPAYVCATVLDPNHKTIVFGDDSYKLLQKLNIVKDEAFKDILEKDSKETVKYNPAVHVATVENKKPDKPGRKLWQRYQRQKMQQSQKVSNVYSQRGKLDEELKRYIDEGAFGSEVDPIEWWIDHGQSKYPLLYETALKFLSVPATSVPSERVFSGNGEMLRKKRNRLSGPVANMIIILNKNLETDD